MRVRFPGLSYYLYLGRGSHFEGFWGTFEAPPPEVRIKDRFLEYLRKALLSTKIRLVKMDECDRIIYIPYFKSKKLNCLSFFWKGRDLYFQNIFFDNSGKYKCLKSWIGITQELLFDSEIDEYQMIEVSKKNFDELNRGIFKSPRLVEKNIKLQKKTTVEDYFKSDIFKKSDKEVRKRVKSLLIKLRKIENDLEKVREYKTLENKLIENTSIY